jgi:hypothetical protein
MNVRATPWKQLESDCVLVIDVSDTEISAVNVIAFEVEEREKWDSLWRSKGVVCCYTHIYTGFHKEYCVCNLW